MMKKLLFIFGSLVIAWLVATMPLNGSPDCPTTSICPEDGITGNPTGQYKWQGAIEFAQFSHPLTNAHGGKHTWWERCN